MIENSEEYRITCWQCEKFRMSIENFDLEDTIKRVGSVDLANAELEALKSEYDNLSEQIGQYKK